MIPSCPEMPLIRSARGISLNSTSLPTRGACRRWARPFTRTTIPVWATSNPVTVLVVAMTLTTFLTQRQLMSKNMPADAMTGQYAHVNGVTTLNGKIEPARQHLARLMHEAGYQTAMIGKWHLKTDPTGFDYWEILPGQGSYYNPDLIQMDGQRKRYTGYCTDVVTELAVIDSRLAEMEAR